MLNSLVNAGVTFLATDAKLFDTFGGRELFTSACFLLGAVEIVLLIWGLIESRESKEPKFKKVK